MPYVYACEIKQKRYATKKDKAKLVEREKD